MLRFDGYFDVSDRRREKEEARPRDERLIAEGVCSSDFIARRNGFFSALDPSKAKIIQRRVPVCVPCDSRSLGAERAPEIDSRRVA
jgi:hypothetical protein